MSEIRSHYAIGTVESVEELREMFPLGEADELNWLFLSTSGIHGSSTHLETLERHFAPDEPQYITVLVVQPRLVRTLYGEIEVGPEDYTFLRGLVRSTLVAVAKSQAGNL